MKLNGEIFGDFVRIVIVNYINPAKASHLQGWGGGRKY
jgi:hypothetical protein